jgi:putative protease
MNVLVFDAEMPRVEERVRQMATAGVDAVIVQDLGVVQLIRRVAPNLPVHGSTQVCPWFTRATPGTSHAPG